MNKQIPLHLTAISLFAGSIITYMVLYIPESSWKGLAADDGIIQNIGMTLVSISCALSFFFMIKEKVDRRFWLLVSYILLIYMCREADYHRTASEFVKITKFIKFYIHPQEALWFKAYIFMIEAVLIYSVYWLVKNYAKFFIQSLKTFEAWAISVLFWFVVFVSSQVMDQLHNYIYASRIIEESLEATAELITIYAVIIMFFDKITHKRHGHVTIESS